MPLKKLIIIGQESDAVGWLNSDDVAASIAAGRFDLDRKKFSARDLVEAFGAWSPVARSWATEELARSPECMSMVPELVALAGSNDVHFIQSACETLGLLNDTRALPVLVKQLSNPCLWVRYKAAQAIRRMGGTAKLVPEDLLKALAQTTEPLWPINWADPVQIAQG